MELVDSSDWSFNTPPSTGSDHCPNDGDIINIFDMETKEQRTVQVFTDETGTGYYVSKESAPEVSQDSPSPEVLPEDSPSSPHVVVNSSESSGDLYICSPTPPEEDSISCEEDVAQLKSVFLDLMDDYHDSDWESKLNLTSKIVKEQVIEQEDQAGPSKPKKTEKKEWVSTSFKLKSFMYTGS